MKTMEATRTPPREVTLTAHQVSRRPWEPFGEDEGVRYRTLWIGDDTRSYAGVLRMDPGTAIRPHTHRHAVHHVWVAEGTAVIEGRRLPPGSYIFVPGGVEHGIESAGTEGCTLFYLYLRGS